jgi:hypothetical protein
MLTNFFNSLHFYFSILSFYLPKKFLFSRPLKSPSPRGHNKVLNVKMESRLKKYVDFTHSLKQSVFDVWQIFTSK